MRPAAMAGDWHWVELLAGRSSFGQCSIIEAVGTRLSGKYLPAEVICFAEAGPTLPLVGRKNGGVGSAAQKRGEQIAVLASSHGAGGVNQSPARRHEAPRGREQPPLEFRQFVDIRRGLTQTNIGMPADYTQGGAGCIEQDAIERHAVPPGRGAA